MPEINALVDHYAVELVPRLKDAVARFEAKMVALANKITREGRERYGSEPIFFPNVMDHHCIS